MTFLDAARALGADGGIETLVVFLGSNNALAPDLKLAWSGDDLRDLAAKNAYTVWRRSHFAAEFAELEAQVARIDARHVIWATVPHVTIAPLARGVGSKLAPRSRYFPFYTRAWISDDDFDPRDDPHLTGEGAPAPPAATGTCSRSPACSTGWPTAVSSRMKARARRGGRRGRSDRRCARCARRPTRAF